MTEQLVNMSVEEIEAFVNREAEQRTSWKSLIANRFPWLVKASKRKQIEGVIEHIVKVKGMVDRSKC